ncbi:MAG: hypothetical protein V3T17_02795 [Pseudomonadales bacterium]
MIRSLAALLFMITFHASAVADLCFKITCFNALVSSHLPSPISTHQELNFVGSYAATSRMLGLNKPYRPRLDEDQQNIYASYIQAGEVLAHLYEGNKPPIDTFIAANSAIHLWYLNNLARIQVTQMNNDSLIKTLDDILLLSEQYYIERLLDLRLNHLLRLGDSESADALFAYLDRSGITSASGEKAMMISADVVLYYLAYNYLSDARVQHARNYKRFNHEYNWFNVALRYRSLQAAYQGKDPSSQYDQIIGERGYADTLFTLAVYYKIRKEQHELDKILSKLHKHLSESSDELDSSFIATLALDVIDRIYVSK